MTDQNTVSKPAEKGLTLIKKILTGTDVVTRFSSIMGDREAAYYINSVILTVANSEDLQECAPNSIVYSALRAAALKLSCDPAIGEAWLIPFHNSQKNVKEAVFIPGYKGLKNLALRTGKYRYINTSPVYNGEQATEDRITGALKLAGSRLDNTIIGWLAYFEMISGFSKSLYMTVEEIHDHARQYSKTYANKKSKWQSDPSQMERKTVLRLLLNRWADMGAGAAAMLQDEEIIEGNFRIEIPNDAPAPVPSHTIEENMTALGFQPTEQKLPEKPPVPPTSLVLPPAMTIEQAQAVASSDGMRYGDMDAEKLAHVLNGILKALKNGAPTPERKAELEHKRDAAKLLLTTPKPKPETVPPEPEAPQEQETQ